MVVIGTNPGAVLNIMYEKVGNREVIYARLTVFKNTVPRVHQIPVSANVALLPRNLSVLVFLNGISSGPIFLLLFRTPTYLWLGGGVWLS